MTKPVIWFDDCYDIVRRMWGERLIDIANAVAKRLALTHRLTMLPSSKGIAFAAERMGLIDESERKRVIKQETALAQRGFRIPTNMRNDILLRDRMCLRCESTENLQMDHIISVRFGGTSTQDNLQTLCRKCNITKSHYCIDYRGNDSVMYASYLDIYTGGNFIWEDVNKKPSECGSDMSRPLKAWLRRKVEKIAARSYDRESIREHWLEEIPASIESVLGKGWYRSFNNRIFTNVNLDILCIEIDRQDSAVTVGPRGELVFESDEVSMAGLARARERVANRGTWKQPINRRRKS